MSAVDELAPYVGTRPSRTGDTALETQGMAPIPEDGRYGALWRMFTVWFTPNMEISGIFIGTLAPALGLGFGLGLAAIVLGTVIGSLPVAILCTWGPKTGTGQLPLARLPFGRGIVLPAAVQWLSTIGWIALTALFGAQAAHLLFHIPFWAGALIVLIVEGLISIYGYELVHRVEKWGALLMTALFVVLSVRIFQHHITLPHDTVTGAGLVGAFVLMVTIALSGAISWASYASDYSRYLRPSSSSAGVFGCTMAGMVLSYVWVMTIGLAAAGVVGTQTAAGVASLMGGGAISVVALLAIMFAAIVSSTMDDYSGALALQAFGVRIKRPLISGAVMVVAFAAIMWIHGGDTSTRFENVLLFVGYWLSPFCAIVMIDWRRNGRAYRPPSLRSALAFRNLTSGWRALVAFVAGFAAMVPFMNTSIVVGPVAGALHGADIAFYVGFVVTGALYYLLLRLMPAPSDPLQHASSGGNLRSE